MQDHLALLGVLPSAPVAVLSVALIRLLRDVESSLDIPVFADAAAALLVQAGASPCVIVVLAEDGRWVPVGGSGIPESLRRHWDGGGMPSPEDCSADDGSPWGRMAGCSAPIDVNCQLHLWAYGDARLAHLAAVSAWLQVALPVFALGFRHARQALRLTHSSVSLEAEVELRLEEINRLSASERALLRQLQAQTAALQAANAELRQLDELKTAIISGVSHELRTPISTIKTLVHLLRHMALPPERVQHYLAVVDAQCDRQGTLIDDLLSLARLETGGSMLERSPQDLTLIVKRVAERLMPAIEAAGQALIVTAPDESLPAIDAHPTELEQIANNLLSNAHKFTPAGGRIDVRVAAEAGRVHLVVADTGCGIAPEYLDRIFDKFFRAPQLVRSVSGTGLGLAITRRLVESMGGTITVSSSEGQGSCFLVEWKR